jgi:hypothetical protein
MSSNKPIATGFIKGAPTSVFGLNIQLVTKLSEGPTLAEETEKEMDFGNSFAAGEGRGCGKTWSQATALHRICHGSRTVSLSAP